MTPNPVSQVLIETFAANHRMNEILLERLDPAAWRALLPGGKRSEGRTIAQIFSHMHNCRLVWLKRSAPHLKCPAPLDPARCTANQVLAAHRRSSAQCLAILQDALSQTDARRVTQFSRGSWAKDWPAGATMFAYMFAHDAHHRGQIMSLAHQLGYRLTDCGVIWRWDPIWKKLGYPAGPR
jgi:uncharacterized damage-inducible protein DinB